MEKPPYQITSQVLYLVAQIQEVVGELKSFSVAKPSVKLRKENKILTVHHSLAIEGNSLTEDQITAILENKRVLGPKNHILEVKNALNVYDMIESLDPLKEKDLLKAHKELLVGLVDQSGKYRSSQVGILKGTKVSHMAPPAKQVPGLMKNLFDFLKSNKEIPWLIKACVFHYELEFIHPFVDGNGRMGRLWQQLLLMKQAAVFQYISTETLVHKKQDEYYKVLEKCDQSGESTLFIEFSLRNILQAITDFKEQQIPMRLQNGDRLFMAQDHFGKSSFSRKDYMTLHKGISTATASRDLAEGVSQGLLNMSGDKRSSVYKFTK